MRQGSWPLAHFFVCGPNATGVRLRIPSPVELRATRAHTMIDEVWRHLIEKGLLVVVTLVLIRYVTAPLFRPKAEIDAAREGYEPAARARDDAAKRREKAQLDVATYEQMIANAGVPLPWSQPNLPLPKISSASSVPPSKDLNPQPSSSEALSVPSQSPVPTGSATKSSSLLAQFLGSTRGPQNV